MAPRLSGCPRTSRSSDRLHSKPCHVKSMFLCPKRCIGCVKRGSTDHLGYARGVRFTPPIYGGPIIKDSQFQHYPSLSRVLRTRQYRPPGPYLTKFYGSVFEHAKCRYSSSNCCGQCSHVSVQLQDKP